MLKDCHTVALNHLEHRQRSSFEVISHLRSKGFSEDEIEKELRELEEFHYVDDVQFCENYIRYKIGKGLGPVRLELELKEKGINQELIKQSIGETFDRQTESEAAMREVEKMLDSKPDEKTIAKVCRKLAALGYHSEVIYDIVGKMRKYQENF